MIDDHILNGKDAQYNVISNDVPYHKQQWFNNTIDG